MTTETAGADKLPSCIQRVFNRGTNAGAGCGGVGGIVATRWLPIRFTEGVILSEAMERLDEVCKSETFAEDVRKFLVGHTNLLLNPEDQVLLLSSLKMDIERFRAIANDIRSADNRTKQPALLTIALKKGTGNGRFVAEDRVNWNGLGYRGYVVRFSVLVDVEDPDNCIQGQIPE
jgi:hypothetical protein